MLVPIALVREGEVVRIAGLTGGMGVRRKMIDLGLAPGVIVNVVRNSFYGGPLILEYGGTKLAIGRGLAGKILAEVEA